MVQTGNIFIRGKDISADGSPSPENIPRCPGRAPVVECFLLGENESVRGIYIHVPFCVRKCSYCDFYSLTTSSRATGEFLDLLVKEMDLFRERFPEDATAAVDTVYFGGGTPTVIAPGDLCGLLAAIRRRFPVMPGAEITIEANPGTVRENGLRTLRAGGFNRLSVGVQSFSPAALLTLGRIHDAEDNRRTYRDARAAGFDSLGIDLIFGIPGQSGTDWGEDLERAITFLPDHVSAYALAPEPGTPLQAALAEGKIRMPTDEEVAERYAAARRALVNAGYRHYEISNFALPGFESRHNRKYWQREGYAGLGPSAHGLLFPRECPRFGMRTANPSSFSEYGRRIREGSPPWKGVNDCGPEDAWKEALILGLRMTDGVDPAEIETRIGPPPDALRDALNSLVKDGKLLRERNRIRLPDHLFFVSNEILAVLA
jgi:oxygen-independent coproporphyrinogen-3 oxidase